MISPGNTATPIPTRYAGCHFRSRLEARWAVFFDTLGVRWEYEPQGYMVGGGTTGLLFLEPRRYLPDFYLPDLGLWVEVKGSEERLDRDLLLAAVLPEIGLPQDPWGTPPDVSGKTDGRMLLLGPITLPVGPPSTLDKFKYEQPLHTVLSFRKNRVYVNRVVFGSDGRLTSIFGEHQFGCNSCGVTWPENWVLLPSNLTPQAPPVKVTRAYIAARSARFEHGQSGA